MVVLYLDTYYFMTWQVQYFSNSGIWGETPLLSCTFFFLMEEGPVHK